VLAKYNGIGSEKRRWRRRRRMKEISAWHHRRRRKSAVKKRTRKSGESGRWRIRLKAVGEEGHENCGSIV